MSGPVALLGFHLAGRRFAVDAGQVRRVAGYRPELDVGAPLGPPGSRRRALVFDPGDGGERALTVDQVAEVRRVDPAALRRLPPLTSAPPLLRGAWLDGGEVVLLVDLHATWPASASKETP